MCSFEKRERLDALGVFSIDNFGVLHARTLWTLRTLRTLWTLWTLRTLRSLVEQLADRVGGLLQFLGRFPDRRKVFALRGFSGARDRRFETRHLSRGQPVAVAGHRLLGLVGQ